LKEIRPLEDIEVKPNVSTMHFPQTIKANGFSEAKVFHKL
jgi:hypothetical protein